MGDGRAKVCLSWWSISWLRIHLDVQSGRGHVIPWRCGHPVHGRAWKVQGTWYAVRYALRSTGDMAEPGLVFQAGTEWWPLAELKLEVSPQGRHRVFAFESKNRSIAVRYASPADSWRARADVTYDGSDEELDDFFVMVARLARDRGLQAGLAAAWRYHDT